MKSVIHFTKNFDILMAILESKNLRLHYCKEDFCIGKRKISRAAHPMVSFSEYSLSTIDNQIVTYGAFGISFSRKWIEKNRIHPVMYIDSHSLIADSLGALLVARRKQALIQLEPNIKLSIMNIKCFVKNSKGYNSNLKVKDFDFKSENEWRFVPSKESIGGKLISVNRTNYLERPSYYNNKLIDYPLTFDFNDIIFLYVSTKKHASILSNTFSIPLRKIRLSNWKISPNFSG